MHDRDIIERMRDAAPQLLDLIIQYRNDLHSWPSPDSIDRRLDEVNAIIDKILD